MRIALDRFCTFGYEFSRFCLFYAVLSGSLAGQDCSFSPKNWAEGEVLLLTIQALFAREFTTTQWLNGLLEPCSYKHKLVCSLLRAKACSLGQKLLTLRVIY